MCRSLPSNSNWPPCPYINLIISHLTNPCSRLYFPIFTQTEHCRHHLIELSYKRRTDPQENWATWWNIHRFKHSPLMTNRELRQRAHFSQKSSCATQIVEQANAQNDGISFFSDLKSSAETKNVEKSTATYVEGHVTTCKLTLSVLGTTSRDYILSCEPSF